MGKSNTQYDVTHAVWWRASLVTRLFLSRGPKTAKQIMGCYNRAHKKPSRGLYQHLAFLEHHKMGLCDNLVWRLTPLGYALREADRPPTTIERKSIRSHIDAICVKYCCQSADLLGKIFIGPCVPARDHLMANLIDDGWAINTISMQLNIEEPRIKNCAERYWFRIRSRGQG